MGILPIPYVNYENPAWLVSLAATKITGAFGAATFNGTVVVNNAGTGRVVYGPDSYIQGTATELQILQLGSGSLYQDFGNSVYFRRTSDFATMARLTNDNKFIVYGIGNTTASEIRIANNINTWFSSVIHDPNYADTQFFNNFIGNETYGGWKFQNLVGSTVTTKAEIKGDGSLSANSATLRGTLTIPNSGVVRTVDGAKLGTGGGLDPWYLLNSSNGALGLKVGSLVVSSSYADTAPTNGLFVEGAATFNGNVTSDTATYPQFALKLSGVSKGILWYDSVNSRMTLGSGSTSNGMSLDASGNATFWGNINVATTAKLGDFTVATLPSAATYAGFECNVTDSSVTTFGSTVAGGGSSRVKLYSNGTNWTVQAA